MNLQGQPAAEPDQPAPDGAARPVAPRRAVTEEFDGPAPDDDVWPAEPILHDA